MSSSNLILGIDTSNYTTSAAVCDTEGNILSDRRILLDVKKGNRGLRQQEALFQHIANLPVVYNQVVEDIGDARRISAVCVSERPRPVDGSYMPCFNAGICMAETIGRTLNIPIYRTSHQEGHLAAASKDLDISKYIFCHLSGGTCEFIDTDDMRIKGGSLDISFGQLLDRTGVARGLKFPCGRVLDEIACRTDTPSEILKEIKCTDGWFNLSGIETQILRSDISDENIKELFEKICSCLCKALKQLGTKKVLLAGGVASSSFLRNNIYRYSNGLEIYFGKPELCSDNAVGVALTGGRLWLQNL